MGVAPRVDVAVAAIDGLCGEVHLLDELRAVELTVRARLDLRVASAHQQGRQPADLQVQADVEEQVGSIQLERQARLGVDEVGILGGERKGTDADQVSPDPFRQGRQVGNRSDHPDLGPSRSGGTQGNADGAEEKKRKTDCSRCRHGRYSQKGRDNERGGSYRAVGRSVQLPDMDAQEREARRNAEDPERDALGRSGERRRALGSEPEQRNRRGPPCAPPVVKQSRAGRRGQGQNDSGTDGSQLAPAALGSQAMIVGMTRAVGDHALDPHGPCWPG